MICSSLTRSYLYLPTRAWTSGTSGLAPFDQCQWRTGLRTPRSRMLDIAVPGTRLDPCQSQGILIMSRPPPRVWNAIPPTSADANEHAAASPSTLGPRRKPTRARWTDADGHPPGECRRSPEVLIRVTADPNDSTTASLRKESPPLRASSSQRGRIIQFLLCWLAHGLDSRRRRP